MPSALKLQEEYGDALQVLFVECQGSTRDQYEAFAWKMKWMGGRAMWTDERPFATVGNGLPETALVGVDGKILFQGYPDGKIEELLAAEVKKAKEAPAGTAAALKKPWSSFLKGDVGPAIAECEKLATDEAKAARDEFVARAQRRIARVKKLVEEGLIVEADALVAKLARDVKGAPELETAVAAETARLAEPERAAERAASQAYTTFVGQVAKKKPFDAPNVKKAEGLAEKHAGTKSGERAARFVALSKVKMSDG